MKYAKRMLTIHPHSQRYEIPNIHTYYSIVTCVSPVSNTGLNEAGFSGDRERAQVFAHLGLPKSSCSIRHQGPKSPRSTGNAPRQELLMKGRWTVQHALQFVLVISLSLAALGQEKPQKPVIDWNPGP